MGQPEYGKEEQNSFIFTTSSLQLYILFPVEKGETSQKNGIDQMRTNAQIYDKVKTFTLGLNAISIVKGSVALTALPF